MSSSQDEPAGAEAERSPPASVRGWADLRARAKWQLTGPDRVRFLNGQVTNNVARLRTGETCWALVCTAKGRLEAEVFIRAEVDCLRVDVSGALRESLGARLEKYLIADDCAWEDVTDRFALWHELGTGSVNRFGVPGRDVWQAAADSPPNRQVSADALDLLRLEHGIPVWGAELTPETLPQEARIQDRAVDFHKGCYVGQEVISRLKSVGHVNRELHGFIGQTLGRAEVRPGDRLYGGDGPADAGWVTSARWHPRLDKTVALGYVRRTLAIEGAVFRAGTTASALSPPLVLTKFPLA